jgi:hypothetical protein
MRGNDGSFHEQLIRDERIVGPSNRSFGFTIGSVLALIGLAKLWSAAPSAPGWVVAAVFVWGAALLVPGWLAPLNRLWSKLGLVLYRVVNPVVMGVLFFLVVTPTALLMRLFGRRPLHLAREPGSSSYWSERRSATAGADSMRRQF